MRRLLFIVFVSALFTIGVSAQTLTTGAAPAATTTEKPKKAPIFRPTKDQIKQVQTILKDKKLYTGEASGTYNDETRTGIKSFQKDNGLKQTGTLNRATLEKFGVELTEKQKLIPVSPNSFATADSEKTTTKVTKTETNTVAKTTTAATTEDKPKKPAPFRANVDQIKAAQKILKDGKMYSGEETGKLDDPTREGLKKFQEANGLKVTGTLNAVTLEKMGIALTDAQKANVAAAAAYAAAAAAATPKN